MAGERAPDRSTGADWPLADPPPTVIENAHTPDPNLSTSEEFSPDTRLRSGHDRERAEAGGSDIARSSDTAPEPDGNWIR